MEKIIGPLGIRTMHFEKAGDKCEGHVHNFDHVTYVLTGGVKVKFHKLDSEGNPIQIGEKEFYAPKKIAGDTGNSCAILIKKDWYHTIIALEDHTHCHCIFSHRNPDTGEVVEDWNGWMKAMQ